MKLNQVLTEGPITYRQGGERFGAWEEPDDEGDESQTPGQTEEATIPMTLSDGTKLSAKVSLEYSQEQDAHGGTYVQVHHVEVQSITLPTGQEIEPQVAKQQLGDEELDQEAIQFDVEAYLSTAMKGARVEFDANAVMDIGGGEVSAAAPSVPATARTPVAA